MLLIDTMKILKKPEMPNTSIFVLQ